MEMMTPIHIQSKDKKQMVTWGARYIFNENAKYEESQANRLNKESRKSLR